MSQADLRLWSVSRETLTFGAFLVGMFVWSWGYWGLIGLLLDQASVSQLVILPGLWGAPISAVVLVWASGRSVRRYLSQWLPGGEEPRWYALAVLGPIGLGCLAPLAQGLWLGLSLDVNLMTPLLTLGVAIFAGGLEEIGLRGFAHDQLRSRYNTFWTGILIGIPWAIWHLPLHWLGVGFQGSSVLFICSATALSVLLGWFYEQAGPSVMSVIIAHAAFDASPVLSPVGAVPDEVELASRVVVLVVYWGLAMSVLVSD